MVTNILPIDDGSVRARANVRRVTAFMDQFERENSRVIPPKLHLRMTCRAHSLAYAGEEYTDVTMAGDLMFWMLCYDQDQRETLDEAYRRAGQGEASAAEVEMVADDLYARRQVDRFPHVDESEVEF